jgi:hypothetical protein
MATIGLFGGAETYVDHMDMHNTDGRQPTQASSLFFQVRRRQVVPVGPRQLPFKIGEHGLSEQNVSRVAGWQRDGGWLRARCDNRTDVEKHLSDLFDAKIMRGEKFTPEEEVVHRALGKKLYGQVQCEEDLKDAMRAAAWKAYNGL